MERTANLNLPQWEASDPIRRGDFNEAMAAIDVMAAGSCRIAWGSYTGTGTYGAANPNSLSFDFKPMIVFVGCDARADSDTSPAVLIRGRRSAASDYMSISAGSQIMTLTWNGSGVSWYCEENAKYQCNMTSVYYYVALGTNA